MNNALKKLEQRFNKTSRTDKKNDAEKELLQQIFKPYNQQLHQLLLSKGYTEFPEWVKE